MNQSSLPSPAWECSGVSRDDSGPNLRLLCEDFAKEFVISCKQAGKDPRKYRPTLKSCGYDPLSKVYLFKLWMVPKP